MKPLSSAQYALLQSISCFPRGRPVRILHVTYAPMRRLVARRMVERVARQDGWACFRITTTGLQALAFPSERLSPRTQGIQTGRMSHV